MTSPTRLLLSTALCVAVSSCGGGSQGSDARKAESTVREAHDRNVITTTLDGKDVLPAQLRWIAKPKISGTVKEVRFLIDGRLRWIERETPYTFGQDGGYLVTTWLAPGAHRFTVRVETRAGRGFTHTVVARVGATHRPPAELAGRWTRRVTPADQRKSQLGDPPPAGRWDIVIDRVGIWELDPLGGGLVTEYRAGSTTLNTYAPIQMAPDGVGISRYGRHGIGGYACSPQGPFGSYRWSVSDSKLRLTSAHEPCGGQRALLEGVWTPKR